MTNRALPGDKLIGWYRQRCGKGEEVHGVLKEDLAGGRLQSGLFGANAAWWAIAVLALNPVWGYGAGSQLGAEALGVGRRVAKQTAQGRAIRPDRACRTSRASCQEHDHPPAQRTPFIQPATQSSRQDAGTTSPTVVRPSHNQIISTRSGRIPSGGCASPSFYRTRAADALNIPKRPSKTTSTRISERPDGPLTAPTSVKVPPPTAHINLPVDLGAPARTGMPVSLAS